RPPLPPSGPPSGLNFSRWIDAQPLPPSPAATWTSTRSTNCGARPATVRTPPGMTKGGPEHRARPQCCVLSGPGERPRDHVDDAPPAARAELDRPGDQGEQRVVAAAPDACAGVK